MPSPDPSRRGMRMTRAIWAASELGGSTSQKICFSGLGHFVLEGAGAMWGRPTRWFSSVATQGRRFWRGRLQVSCGVCGFARPVVEHTHDFAAGGELNKHKRIVVDGRLKHRAAHSSVAASAPSTRWASPNPSCASVAASCSLSCRSA